MDLIALLQGLKASIDALQAQLVDAQAAAQAAYDKGFQDGVASVQPSGPSQADLDAALAKVAELEAKVAALQVEVDALPGKVADAVAAVKVGAKAALDAFEAQENQSVEEAKAVIDAL